MEPSAVWNQFHLSWINELNGTLLDKTQIHPVKSTMIATGYEFSSYLSFSTSENR